MSSNAHEDLHSSWPVGGSTRYEKCPRGLEGMRATGGEAHFRPHNPRLQSDAALRCASGGAAEAKERCWELPGCEPNLEMSKS